MSERVRASQPATSDRRESGAQLDDARLETRLRSIACSVCCCCCCSSRPMAARRLSSRLLGDLVAPRRRGQSRFSYWSPYVRSLVLSVWSLNVVALVERWSRGGDLVVSNVGPRAPGASPAASVGRSLGLSASLAPCVRSFVRSTLRSAQEQSSRNVRSFVRWLAGGRRMTMGCHTAARLSVAL